MPDDEPLAPPHVFPIAMEAEAVKIREKHMEIASKTKPRLSTMERRDADDETLALAARSGDHLAFAELFARYHPLFFTYASRRLGEDGQDAVQTAFLAIFNGLRKYKGPRFFSWAYRICVNTVTDILRKKKVRADVDGKTRSHAPSESGSPSAPTPEQELITRQLSRSISTAIMELPEGHRTVFILARVHGLDYREISELLNIPVGTVKSRMWKAVKQLFDKGASQ